MKDSRVAIVPACIHTISCFVPQEATLASYRNVKKLYCGLVNWIHVCWYQTYQKTPLFLLDLSQADQRRGPLQVKPSYTHPTRSHFVLALLQHVPFEAVTIITVSLLAGGEEEYKKEGNETERSSGLCGIVCPAPELEHPKSLKWYKCPRMTA